MRQHAWIELGLASRRRRGFGGGGERKKQRDEEKKKGKKGKKRAKLFVSSPAYHVLAVARVALFLKRSRGERQKENEVSFFFFF
jgi:hypothetical protein